MESIKVNIEWVINKLKNAEEELMDILLDAEVAGQLTETTISSLSLAFAQLENIQATIETQDQ